MLLVLHYWNVAYVEISKCWIAANIEMLQILENTIFNIHNCHTVGEMPSLSIKRSGVASPSHAAISGNSGRCLAARAAPSNPVSLPPSGQRALPEPRMQQLKFTT